VIYLPNAPISDALRERIGQLAARDRRAVGHIVRELLDTAAAERLGLEPLGNGAHEDEDEDARILEIQKEEAS